MIIDNAILILDELYEPTGGPQFNTGVQEWGDGSEQRSQLWEYPLSTWEFGGRRLQASKISNTWPAIQAFFHARGGREKGFYYKDWNDWQAANEAIDVGDGVRTQFQLIKTYSSGMGTGFVRKITRVVQNTLFVMVNGVPVVGASVDLLTGKITLSNPPAPGAVIAADYDFLVPVRFTVDEIEARLVHQRDDTFVDLGRLAMEEIRL